MGSGGDGEKQPPSDIDFPPVYQEKVPLPDGDQVVIVEAHPPVYAPVVERKRKCTKKRFCCCTGVVLLLIFLTLTPAAIVHILGRWWLQPHVHMELKGSSERHSARFMTGQDVMMECHVKTRAHYLPLIQWFHDANEAAMDGETTYKMFAVHNQITDSEYKDRFEIVKTEAYKHGIKYTMMIRDAQPEDAGYYGCQVPKHHHHHHHRDEDFVDEVECKSCSHSSSHSSSSSDSDEKHGDDNDSDEKRKHHEKKHFDDNDSSEKHGEKKKKCFRGDNHDYVYVDISP